MRALAAALAALSLLAPAAPAGLVVRLRATARVEGPEVTLREVAVLSGPANAVRAAGEVVLAEGVKPGGAVRVTAADVRAALRGAGFDAKSISVVGAREVLIRRGEASAAVRRGRGVRVVAAVGLVRVTTTGLALEAGDVGDTIRVRVLATRREVLARVVEPGLVAVAF